MPPPACSTLFPYTTLFRSLVVGHRERNGERPARGVGVRRVRLGRCRRAVAEVPRSEEHTSELQSHSDLVCRLLLEKKKYSVVKSPTECQQSLFESHFAPQQ